MHDDAGESGVCFAGVIALVENEAVHLVCGKTDVRVGRNVIDLLSSQTAVDIDCVIEKRKMDRNAIRRVIGINGSQGASWAGIKQMLGGFRKLDIVRLVEHAFAFLIGLFSLVVYLDLL